MEEIRLGIIEDKPTIRESLVSYFEENPTIQIQLVASSVELFLEKIVEQNQPDLDVLLLDIGLPGMTGIQGIPHIKGKYPDLDIIMLTTYEEDDKIFSALCAGACSYISKRTSLAKIMEAIYIVSRGGSYMSPSIARRVVQRFIPQKAEPKKDEILTPRQKEIVKGIVDGLSYKMIADRLDISLDTVRDHIKRIYRALEINSKAEMIRKSLEGNLE